ncbi:MAG TPA: NADP-dependent oxidoreductase [Candidatus Binataceae bacterium]|nr:NADP-dependent oxidoreductase [Candidatus Binataceae bacterium]
MEASQTMNAIRSHRRGGPETLVYEPVARPAPGSGEVLVEVCAAAITPTEFTWDPTWTDQHGRSRLPIIPSHEISGVVAQTGPDAPDIAAGDEVYGLIDFYRDGAAAEFAIAKVSELAPKPRSVDHLHAAALPLSALTAWQAFRTHAFLRAGQRVLIHGGAGGVGNFAVQLAKHFGAETIATCSRGNADFVKSLGADSILEYDRKPFEENLKDIDLVLDTVGGETLERSWRVVRRRGALISVVEEPPAAQAERFGVSGKFFIVEPNRGQLVELAKLVDDGSLKPIVSETFPLAAARRAYEAGSRGHLRGKIVLRVR